MQPSRSRARDGLTLPGYLTLAVGVAAKNLPMVHVHGGPWARDDWGYDPTRSGSPIAAMRCCR